MHSGQSEKLMVWTFSLFLLFIIVNFPHNLFSATSLTDNINLFRDEISYMRRIVPSLPWPDPAPSDIEDLSKKSPSKAAVLLKKAMKSFRISAAKHLNLEIVNIGRSIKSSPTNSENYQSRRTILVTLEKAAKTNNLSVSGLFPKGPPSIHLPQNNSSDKAYEYCNTSFTYLAGLLFKSLPSGLKSQVTNGGGGGTSGDKTDKDSKDKNVSNPSFSATQDVKNKNNNPKNAGKKTNSSSSKSQWQIIGMYFNWIIYIFAGLAVAGLLHNVYKSFSGLSELEHDGLKSKDENVVINQTVSSGDFKKAMKHFKSSQYQKAIDVFNSLSDGEGNLDHNAVFYQILSEIGLAQTDRALKGIEKEGYEAFSLEELYRMAHSFEDIGDLTDCLKMYIKVQEKDNTFRNISQRVNAVKQKIEIKQKQEK